MLSKRAQNLLNTLVERYIASGQPVGSKSLVDAGNLSLSPATIRSVLAELEGEGFVKSPHTSAGRIPTAQGYHFFINHLVAAENFAQSDLIEKGFKPNQSPADLFQTASSLLSDLTQFAGIVTLPKRNQVTLDHVEFLTLSGLRVLCIFVLNTGEVENRVITTKKEYARHELEQAANYLNTHFTGMSLETLRHSLVDAMKKDKLQLDDLLKSALYVAENSMSKEDYLLDGQHNLLNTDDAQDLSKVRALFDAFAHKNEILSILDECIESEGIQIFIGEESGHAGLDDHSLVVSSYQGQDNVVGVLGVIGPTRMHYERVIPIVNVTARLLTAALNE